MFLPCKFAFDITKENGGVPSYFSCYRAASDRVRFMLFRKYNWQCPVATILKFPLLESSEGLVTMIFYPCPLIKLCAVSEEVNCKCF